MDRLKALYEHAEEMDVCVVYAHFSDTKKAACLCGAENNIVLDKGAIASEYEERELLGHEMTHIETGNLYYLELVSSIRPPARRTSRRVMEGKTRNAWIMRDLPPERLQEAINEVGVECWAIAEYCGNTESFVRQAFELYQSKGISFDWGDCE